MMCLLLIFFMQDFRPFSADPAIKYIDTYKDLAVKEMERSGIPASIKLAQALLESDYGNSPLATNANNHFGIKCGKFWTGKIYEKEDDETDQEGNKINSCFRVFESVEASFIAHSDFIKDAKKQHRYGFLFTIQTTDYQAWAHGLKQAGYATDPDYAKKLLHIIEKYKLHELDLKSAEQNNEDKNIKEIPVVAETKNQLHDREKRSRLKSNEHDPTTVVVEKAIYRITYINKCRTVFIPQKISVENLARDLRINTSELIAFNEILKSPTQQIMENTYIYLTEKKRDYTGSEAIHLVKEGETLESISNIYGIRANTLYSLNKIPKSCQPLVGQRLRITDRISNCKKIAYKKRDKAPIILF